MSAVSPRLLDIEVFGDRGPTGPLPDLLRDDFAGSTIPASGDTSFLGRLKLDPNIKADSFIPSAPRSSNIGDWKKGLNKALSKVGIESSATEASESSAKAGDKFEGGLTPKQAVGISALSSALGVAGGLASNRADYKMNLESMRHDYDRAFGSLEFDSHMIHTRMLAQHALQLAQTQRNVASQGDRIATQGADRQTQTFFRNPVTGARI